ncbi:MAG: DUF192 domain-containing protein [bacterium]|nr:DUF192 domain-containing protein [bacterium]
MYLILKDNKKLEIKEYKSFFKKLLGLMFKKEKINYIVRLNNCNSIHTFFMKQNIDVIITDKKNNILYKRKNITKNKVIFPIKNGYYVYEMPEGTIDKINKFVIYSTK